MPHGIRYADGANRDDGGQLCRAGCRLGIEEIHPTSVESGVTGLKTEGS